MKTKTSLVCMTFLTMLSTTKAQKTDSSMLHRIVNRISISAFSRRSEGENITYRARLEYSLKEIHIESILLTQPIHNGITVTAGPEFKIWEKVILTPSVGVFAGEKIIPIASVKGLLKTGKCTFTVMSQIGDSRLTFVRTFAEIKIHLSKHFELEWETTRFKNVKDKEFLFTEQENGPILTFKAHNFAFSLGYFYSTEWETTRREHKRGHASETRKGMAGLAYCF